MRDMILNEASVVKVDWDEHKASCVAVDLAEGMSALVRSGLANNVLRMAKQMYEIAICKNCSLFDLVQQMLKSGEQRDAAKFWLRLVQKSPLLTDLDKDLLERFRGCEPLSEFGSLSEGMLLCAHAGGVAISMPSHERWNKSLLTVDFFELDVEGELSLVSELIDHISVSNHAEEIIERWRMSRFNAVTPDRFWSEKQDIFPYLGFGLDVESQLASIGGAQFLTILGRIDELNASAAEWKEKKGAAPTWRSLVSGESQKTMQDESFRKLRFFRNKDGQQRLYEWHGRYGSSGRIHFAFDAKDQTVEIGYIGPHLPIKP